jgi:hypothetical protein
MKMVWGHVSTSGSLLRPKASQARVSQFCLKIGGGVTTDGARGIIMEGKSLDLGSEIRLVQWCRVRRS